MGRKPWIGSSGLIESCATSGPKGGQRQGNRITIFGLALVPAIRSGNICRVFTCRAEAAVNNGGPAFRVLGQYASFSGGHFSPVPQADNCTNCDFVGRQAASTGAGRHIVMRLP